MMIFHLITENPTYINTFISIAENLAPCKNKYVLIKDGKKTEIERASQTDLRGAIKMFEAGKFDKIIIHYLNLPAIKFLNRITTDASIYWIFWGGDGYRHPALKNNLYLPKTLYVLNQINHHNLLERTWTKFRNYIYRKKLEKSLYKIDYCCTQIKGDYDLIIKAVPGLKMKHEFFAYKGVNKKTQLSSIEEKRNNKLKVLLGNSANPTNNHLDILEKLVEYKDRVERIVCPLSYGGSDVYINKVVTFGKQKFGNKFVPLTELLPFNKYQELIKSIDISLFYHTRQQGYANTIMMLEQNKKILMHSNSTLYDMYKEFDVKNVYTDLEKLFNSRIESNENLYKHLGQEVIENWYDKVLN